MRKIILFSLLLVLVAGGGWWLQNWWSEGRYWESTDNAYTQADITIISAKVPGIVDKVNVKNNQEVAAGDILISMFKPTFDAAVAKAQAQLARAQAALATIENKLRMQHSLVAAARAEVETAQAQLKKAELDLVRAEQLKNRGFAEKQRYDHALTDVASGKAELSRTRANLVAVSAQQDVLRAESEELRRGGGSRSHKKASRYRFVSFRHSRSPSRSSRQ